MLLICGPVLLSPFMPVLKSEHVKFLCTFHSMCGSILSTKTCFSVDAEGFCDRYFLWHNPEDTFSRYSRKLSIVLDRYGLGCLAPLPPGLPQEPTCWRKYWVLLTTESLESGWSYIWPWIWHVTMLSLLVLSQYKTRLLFSFTATS